MVVFGDRNAAVVGGSGMRAMWGKGNRERKGTCDFPVTETQAEIEASRTMAAEKEDPHARAQVAGASGRRRGVLKKAERHLPRRTE